MSTEDARDQRWDIRVSSACIGSGICVATAPRYFHLVDGYSQPRDTRVEPDDVVVAALELCPMSAVSIRRTHGKRQAPGTD